MSSVPAQSARWALGSRLGFALLGVALLVALLPGYAALCALLGNLLLGSVLAWDARRLLRAQLTVVRSAPARVLARQPARYTLSVQQAAGPALRLQLEDLAPVELTLQPARHRAQVSPGHDALLEAQLSAHSHGLLAWSTVAVRKESALGLCARIEQLECPHSLRVLPRLPLSRRALATLAKREPGGATQRLRPLGQGHEVEALREYVATDSMRSIDWKATAKRRRPITRSYQPERSQALWIVLDASRAMTLPVADGDAAAAPHTRFDVALRAALQLADAALFAGDRVGLLVYGHEALLSVPPRRGRSHFVHLVERVLTVHARASELDVLGMLGTLATLAKKRSLVVLFTDLENEPDLHLLAEHAPLLARRHLALCVSLEEKQLQSELQGALNEEQDVYRRVAALSLHTQRASLARTLARRGMPVIETHARGLSGAALKRYREIKQSGRL